MGPSTRRAMAVVSALAVVGLVSVSCGRDATTEATTASRVPSRGSAPAPTQANQPTPSGTGSSLAPTTEPPPSTASPSTPSTPTTPTTTAPRPAPGATPTSPTPAAAPPGAPHPVATTVLALSDGTRPTVSRGRTIASSRSLPTTVYYPNDSAGPYPLVAFAHGFEIGPGPYAHICQVMAAAGYVVAAPSFPLTDRNAAGANLDRGDLPNQAGDVAFVVTAVTGAGGPLAGRVDGSKVGVVGHSDGADTALDVGYFPFRNDPRVRAVVAFAPDAMTGPGGSVGTAPLLLAQGDRDSVVPYTNSVTVFSQVHTHRFFVTFIGADHLPVVQGAAPWAAVHERVLVDFLDRYVAGRTADDSAIAAHGNVPGVASMKTAG